LLVAVPVWIGETAPRQMKITENVRPARCGTAELGIAEEEAFKRGMEEKSKEFVEKGVFEDHHASTQAYLKAMIFVRE
jgi:tetraacyldisaccharide-1-P 4'-kinase